MSDAKKPTAEEIRAIVREGLNNADEGGWSQKEESVGNMVSDLRAYCDGLWECEADDVRPHVEEWRKDKGYG